MNYTGKPRDAKTGTEILIKLLRFNKRSFLSIKLVYFKNVYKDMDYGYLDENLDSLVIFPSESNGTGFKKIE